MDTYWRLYLDRGRTCRKLPKSSTARILRECFYFFTPRDDAQPISPIPGEHASSYAVAVAHTVDRRPSFRLSRMCLSAAIRPCRRNTGHPPQPAIAPGATSGSGIAIPFARLVARKPRTGIQISTPPNRRLRDQHRSAVLHRAERRHRHPLRGAAAASGRQRSENPSPSG